MKITIINIFAISIGLVLGILLSENKTIGWLFIAASVFFLIISCYIEKNKIKNLYQWRKIENSNTLFEASAFHATIAIAILISILFLYDNKYLLSPDVVTIKSLYKAFQEPVLVFGLSLPIVALIANHHRSMQTHKQIESSRQYNTFNNYLKHRELFENFCKEHDLFKKHEEYIHFRITDIYNSIFSEALKSTLHPSTSFHETIIKIKKWTEALYQNLDNMKKEYPQNKNYKIDQLLFQIEELENIVSIGLRISVEFHEFKTEEPDELANIIVIFADLLIELKTASNFIFPSDSNIELDQAILRLLKARRTLAFMKHKEKNNKLI